MTGRGPDGAPRPSAARAARDRLRLLGLLAQDPRRAAAQASEPLGHGPILAAPCRTLISAD
ncbi:MAG: hypothetical protein AUI14_04410 [Actinobacteria bacterium 13_2_20CM_2_71_6]|nr:MAG: hypothetical protein AUI14_04410 [Actinobacteria bacterium 13_2_20CM_2_71_6]